MVTTSDSSSRTRVLITGGSGYLGQFLIAALKQSHSIAYTYLHNAITAHPVNAEPFKVDLATGEGLQEAVLQFKPQVVVNCAALSQPAACELDYEACRKLNVPSKLVEALKQLQRKAGIDALLIHISTDQVYDGSRPDWAETDPTQPVNAYGRSKLEAEQNLAAAYPHKHVVLRASLIYGPQPPLQAVGRPLFAQFVESQLAQGIETSFFVDEFRSAVYVNDICEVVKLVISKYSAAAAAAASDTGDACHLAALPHSIYNMGGPERLGRHDMAMAVAQHCGHSSKAIKPANSADVQRGYSSPADISMKMEQLLADMPSIRLTPFAEGLAAIFPSKAA
uniref:RmlD-like substrate binding domain-containing protein n=1 Tax=Tetradesmus obliquus TaxID=3088 RepID=A0A383WL45_TETOB|eukprot:jgi/Sobl393_1/18345/SZX77942.1